MRSDRLGPTSVFSPKAKSKTSRPIPLIALALKDTAGQSPHHTENKQSHNRIKHLQPKRTAGEPTGGAITEANGRRTARPQAKRQRNDATLTAFMAGSQAAYRPTGWRTGNAGRAVSRVSLLCSHVPWVWWCGVLVLIVSTGFSVAGFCRVHLPKSSSSIASARSIALLPTAVQHPKFSVLLGSEIATSCA